MTHFLRPFPILSSVFWLVRGRNGLFTRLLRVFGDLISSRARSLLSQCHGGSVAPPHRHNAAVSLRITRPRRTARRTGRSRKKSPGSHRGSRAGLHSPASKISNLNLSPLRMTPTGPGPLPSLSLCRVNVLLARFHLGLTSARLPTEMVTVRSPRPGRRSGSPHCRGSLCP